MDVKILHSLPYPTWLGSEKMCFGEQVMLGSRAWCQKRPLVLNVGCFSDKYSSNRRMPVVSELSSSLKGISGLESVNAKSSSGTFLALKNKSEKIVPYLNGRCIYLVGMMGCGKTTVGKILAEQLGYSFVDSDAVVEQITGNVPVTEIFQLHGEAFFRDKESEVLLMLSQKSHLVISTGGGAVIRPVNWKYMSKGISIWLDVPLEALAQRLATVGTNSRPLLPDGSTNVFEKTFCRLSTLFQERGQSYAAADARVSFDGIASRLGIGDVSSLTPSVIAFEVFEQIDRHLQEGMVS